MPKTLTITLPEKTYECQVCRGSGHVLCPNQKCTHWEECTACAGCGKVFCVDLMTVDGSEVQVSLPARLEGQEVTRESRIDRICELLTEIRAENDIEIRRAIKGGRKK